MNHEHSMHQHHATHQSHDAQEKPQVENIFKLAFSATLHCLLGCGIGEVVGMVIATWLGMSMVNSMILAVILGFVAGLALGIVPLLRNGFSFRHALKTVIVAEGLSIAVMEAFEVGTQVLIPGVMKSGLTDGIFWLGMTAGLIVGFIAAFPVNYAMIKRGVRHQH